MSPADSTEQAESPAEKRPLAAVLNWAHQGGAREGPSNTIWAMKNAVHNRANALEFDVQLTRDRRLVVAHDQRLGRVSYGEGWIRRHTLSALKGVDAGYWWVKGKKYDHHAKPGDFTLRGMFATDASLQIPTVEEMLAALDDFAPGLPLTIEVKAFRAAKPLVELIGRSRRHNVTVTAMWTPILWRIRQVRKANGLEDRVSLSPAGAYIYWFVGRSFLGCAPKLSPYTRLQIPRLFARRAVVNAARGIPLAVDVWTIDDRETMKGLICLGVEGIMTDSPSVLTNVLGVQHEKDSMG